MLELSLLTALSLVGTFVFALSGALLGVRKGFDLLGVVVLGCVTAVGGGSIRDTLTGSVPPLWFRDERLLWAAIAASLLGFMAYRQLERLERVLRVFDSLGLALFAATGAQRGLELGFGPLGVVFVGALSGVGGGVVRDLLAREVPFILYRSNEIYATAAALGSLALYVASGVMPEDAALLVSVATTLALRVLSRRLGLALPARRGVLGSGRMNPTPIPTGETAPDFRLKGTSGEVSLADFRGEKNVLLVFYPLDFSRVCSLQLPEFSGRAAEFAAADTVVLGVSRDSVPTHKAWAREYGIEVPLLSDMKGEAARAYGVWLEDEAVSRRATFLINKEGRVALSHAEDELGHYTLGADAVLEAAKGLG